MRSSSCAPRASRRRFSASSEARSAEVIKSSPRAVAAAAAEKGTGVAIGTGYGAGEASGAKEPRAGVESGFVRRPRRKVLAFAAVRLEMREGAGEAELRPAISRVNGCESMGCCGIQSEA